MGNRAWDVAGPATRRLDVIDSELRLIADVRQACREHGWPTPTTARADELLDERAGVLPQCQ